MANAKRDDNRVTTMLGVSNVDSVTPIPIKVNPVTGRIIAEVTGSTDVNFKVSAADTTTGYGEDKIVAGTGVTINKLNTGANEQLEIVASSGSGDVVGPASAVDSNIAAFDGITGKLIKDGGNTIAQVLDVENQTGFTVDTEYFSGNGKSATPITKSTNMIDMQGFFNGSTLDDVQGNITSDGVTITASFEKLGGGDVRYIASTGVQTIDCTPAATVTLTAGTDSVPQLNYMYVDVSTGLFTANTTGFPATEYVPLAVSYIGSASFVQTNGTYKTHKWSDHIQTSGDNGHLSHINKWIRYQNATWISGSALSETGSGTTTVNIAIASGVMFQLHEHTVPAITTPATFYIVNDETTPFTSSTNLASITTDSAGVSVNNKYASYVLWYAYSDITGDSKLFLNKPSGSYSSEADARADGLKYTNFTIPAEFKGTAILIKRLIGRNSGGTLTLYSGAGDDLRGTLPNTAAGSSTSVSSTFLDSTFRVLNLTDETKKIALDASGITTGTTRTATMPDKNIILAGTVEETFTGSGSPAALTVSNSGSGTGLDITNGGSGPFMVVDTTKLVLNNAGALSLGAGALNQFNGANIASATTTDIGAATGNSPHITGTTTITGLGTIQAGVQRTVTFDGILTLTHNATSLILPTGANIASAVGDTADFISEGSGNWRCTNYQRASGIALDAEVTLTGTETLTNKTLTDPKITTTINAQTGTTYTLVLTDASKLVTLSNAAAIALTVPTNASVAFPIGTQIDITQQGAGAVTISGAGTTLNSKGAALTTNGQYVGVTLIKIATDTWNVYGDLV